LALKCAYARRAESNCAESMIATSSPRSAMNFQFPISKFPKALGAPAWSAARVNMAPATLGLY
jgi:hypothetical protein